MAAPFGTCPCEREGFAPGGAARPGAGRRELSFEGSGATLVSLPAGFQPLSELRGFVPVPVVVGLRGESFEERGGAASRGDQLRGGLEQPGLGGVAPAEVVRVRLGARRAVEHEGRAVCRPGRRRERVEFAISRVRPGRVGGVQDPVRVEPARPGPGLQHGPAAGGIVPGQRGGPVGFRRRSRDPAAGGRRGRRRARSGAGGGRPHRATAGPSRCASGRRPRSDGSARRSSGGSGVRSRGVPTRARSGHRRSEAAPVHQPARARRGATGVPHGASSRPPGVRRVSVESPARTRVSDVAWRRAVTRPRRPVPGRVAPTPCGDRRCGSPPIDRGSRGPGHGRGVSRKGRTLPLYSRPRAIPTNLTRDETPLPKLHPDHPRGRR